MAKYHITEYGTPAPCKATKKACPRGGESEHFASKDEAVQYYEKKMESELLAVFSSKPEVSRNDEQFKQEAARKRRIEDALLQADPSKTVRLVPYNMRTAEYIYSGMEHDVYYVHPDFRKALPDDEDFQEYLATVHGEGLTPSQRNDLSFSYDKLKGIAVLTYPYPRDNERK